MDIKEFREILSKYMIVIGITGFFIIGCASVPRFEGLPPYMEVYENISIGTQLFTMEAKDTDENNVMTFKATNTDTNTYINITQFSNHSVARANVTLRTSLDRESHEGGIELAFSVIDRRGYTAYAAVHLYILDVCDEAPYFNKPSYTFDINENCMNGTNASLLVYSSIHANDKDNGINAIVFFNMEKTHIGSFLFKIEVVIERCKAPNPQSAMPTVTLLNTQKSSFWKEKYDKTFSIDLQSGYIYLLQDLDYEENSFYQFTLHAHDTCNLTAIPASLIITVNDVQDKPPFFVGLPYWKSISEGNYMHESVLRVKAIDGDHGIPNPIYYLFIPGDRFCQEHFAINASTGEVVVAGRLDWEMDEVKRIHGICNFIVEAREIDKHPENQKGLTVSNVTVTVIISQSNTQAPHIEIRRTTTGNIQTVNVSRFRENIVDFGDCREMKIFVISFSGLPKCGHGSEFD